MDPDVTGDWNGFMENSASFYRDAQAQRRVSRGREAAASRAGTPSTAAPTTPIPPSCRGSSRTSRGRARTATSTYFDVFTQWIDGTAGFIKKLAPKQLVSTGNEGWMGTAGSRELYVKAHSTKNVDYLTFHMWAPNWSWYDPKKPAATYDGAWQKMQDYLNWHIDAANKLGKPIVLEEFGINRDDGSFSPAATTVYRDRFYTAIYRLLAQRAAAGTPSPAPTSGPGAARAARTTRTSMWKAGDSFVGDPPQEPQGLYCVFDSDASTIAIISANARQMSGLH